jgi:ABC-type Zn uptake system ZnuABC Zn-binding protein ZnuA
MFNRVKLFSVLTILLILLTIAAQCGVQPDQAAQSVTAPQAQVDEAQPEAEHEHEAEAHSLEDELATHLEDLTAVSLGEGEKLKVVATTTIVGDLVSQIGGDAIDLKVLLPLGTDPHAFSPTPQDVAAVADAHVIFINGFGLEEFLRELIQNAGGEAVVISLSAGIEPREFAEGEGHKHEEAAEEPEESETGYYPEGVDPHTFMTAANAMRFVHNIEQTLSLLDLAHAAAYEAKAEAYEAQLANLESWIQGQVATLPPENRRMVTDHESFGYYAGHYGLEIVGAVIPAYSTGAEPSAQELSQLQDAIADYGVRAVFVGTTVNPALAQQVAEDSEVQLVPLYSDSLGAPGSGAETYLDYMRYNTTAIVEALK